MNWPMSQQLDIDNDPFLVLLTDALRAGPGSPQWHEAVAKLKTSAAPVDEYQLLIEARQALESGKDYRSVRAGPGFTRKLLNDINQQKPPGISGRRIPVASVVALIAVAVIVIVGAALVYELYPRTNPSPGPGVKGIEDLAASYFPNIVLSSTFEMGIPTAWRTIGSLPLECRDGLRAGAADVQPGNYVGGGIVSIDPFSAEQPFSALVTIRTEKPQDTLIPQVFITNNPDFSTDRAVSSGVELVWQLKSGQQQVVLGGDIKQRTPLPAHNPTLSVRLVVNHDLAVLECNGQPIWAGPNALGDKPRYLGVRFLRTAGAPSGPITIQSIRVQKPT